jgi:hypothetical protein
MSQFAIAASRRRSFGGSKGALYRETLQATGFYVGRVVIATAEFAPMPPFVPGYPGGHHSDGHRMRFPRHDGIYQSDVGFLKPQNPSRTPPPADAPARARERAGRITLSPIVLMSSGRLFLDRVGRHQSPSPLRRRHQNNLIARSEERIYHRTVTSVLTGCLTFRDKRSVVRRNLALGQQLALFEMPGLGSGPRRVQVVRHHHDGLAELAVKAAVDAFRVLILPGSVDSSRSARAHCPVLQSLTLWQGSCAGKD